MEKPKGEGREGRDNSFVAAPSNLEQSIAGRGQG